MIIIQRDATEYEMSYLLRIAKQHNEKLLITGLRKTPSRGITLHNYKELNSCSDFYLEFEV